MRLLYIGYWSSQEALTVATVIPHLQVLASFDTVEEIIFCSFERSGRVPELSFPKVKHIPLYSKDRGNVIVTKLFEYFLMFASLRKICTKFRVDHVICRSTLAGAFGHRLHKAMSLPFIVESFEPHADYMVESKVWSRYDLRTILQSYYEGQQKKSASCVLPVSHHYAAQLIREGVEEQRIFVLPCCIDFEKFKFRKEKRSLMREELCIPPQSITGIYVGKFGGLYYSEEAFELFGSAFDFFGDRFRLILLTSNNEMEILGRLTKHAIPQEKVIVRSVMHEKVNEYLSASDFAFCTIKPAPSRIYCSPVKNGEYWANGLPILLEPMIGDDSDIVRTEGAGVVIEKGNYRKAFIALQKLLLNGRENLAKKICAIGARHRSLDYVKQAYEKVFLQEER